MNKYVMRIFQQLFEYININTVIFIKQLFCGFFLVKSIFIIGIEVIHYFSKIIIV